MPATSLANLRSPGRNNHRKSSRRNGPDGSVLCAVSPDIAAPLTRAQRFPRKGCYPSVRSGHDLIYIPMTKSAAYCAPPSTYLIASSAANLRPWIFHCLFGLLSVAGLRIGEARNLELQDVDLKAAVLTIRGAKFGKTRLVPLHASTCRVLADYIARRRRHWAGRTVSSYLFVSSWGNRLDGGEIHRTFYALSRKIGLRGAADSHGPRLHDLRHRFATNTLVRWYRSGQDPERRLPLLSTYLGHVHVGDTQWYLESSPELMRQAMQRLEQRWKGRP